MKLKALVTELGGEGEMGFEGKFSHQHSSVSHNTDADLFPLDKSDLINGILIMP